MRSKRTAQLFQDGRPVVVPFLTAGFPNRRVFLAAAQAAHDAGAAALEIGMPFSDPLADGPAIQHSSQRALDMGITLSHVLELTATLRTRIPIPIFLMGYLNPVLKMGLEKFATTARSAGADGTIIPDCPIDEAGEWIVASQEACLENIFLIAPTSTDKRIGQIDRASTAFSYCVSIAGVTGARRDVSDATKSYLGRVRSLTKKPFVVGFGIARPAHVQALSGLADGFVIGSALVPLLKAAPRSSAPRRVARLIRSLVRAAKAD